MAFKNGDKIWLNGRIQDYGAAGMGTASHGLHYGTGVFEGIRCYETGEGPALFRLEEHWDRFYASAGMYGLEIGYTRDELTQGVFDTLAGNGLKSGYIRPICFLGDDTLGVHGKPRPNVAVLAWAWKTPQGEEAAELGMRVTVSPWLKIHRRMLPSTAKACGQYVNSVLAAREAAKRGFDEALLLNADGSIAEGAVENLFLIKNGVLCTNDETSSILPGITRASILDLAEDLGIPTKIRTLWVEDLITADEAFFTGTAVEVAPIRELDGLPIGQGAHGLVTARLWRAFREATLGLNPDRRHWLTPVTGKATTLAFAN